MTIAIGQSLPETTFTVMTAEGPQPRKTSEIFAGHKAALVGLPGAFTPTCHRNHLPGYIEHFAEFAAHGVDLVAVTSVNDVFVMDAWAKATGGAGKILFLADGSAQFAKAIGLVADLTERGLGLRSQRYSMLVEDGVVRQLNLEQQPGAAEISGAKAFLAQL
jgi:peroxiredoxin